MIDLFEDYNIKEKLKNIDNTKYQYIGDSSIEEVFSFYNTLNKNKEHLLTNDDICTPMECVKTMIDYIPNEFWNNNIKILDPCCGNGNFGAYCYFKTNKENIYFNDINLLRIEITKKLLNPIHITNKDALSISEKYDLIMANPPYSGGGNKNKSISNIFIEHCIDLLNDNGYLCFITPNNWMTYNNNNTTLTKLLQSGSFIVIDNDAKKFFPSVGSSFTIFVWQKNVFNRYTIVKNGYLIKDIQTVKLPKTLKFIPLYVSQTIIDIIEKSIVNNDNLFRYRCDLHNFTKKKLLSDNKQGEFKYKTIHTPKKTRYATIKQDIYNKWNIIIPLSTYYIPYIEHNTNVTQSVGYFSFETREEADYYLNKILNQDWIKVLVHITRYGNFNNILLLKHLKLVNNIEFTNEETKEIKKLLNYIKY